MGNPFLEAFDKLEEPDWNDHSLNGCLKMMSYNARREVLLISSPLGDKVTDVEPTKRKVKKKVPLSRNNK